MALATVIFEFNKVLMGQDAYNRLTSANDVFPVTPKLGRNHEGVVESVEYFDVHTHHFAVEDFAKAFAMEYREPVLVRYIPVQNTLVNAISISIDEFGDILEEKRLGWVEA